MTITDTHVYFYGSVFSNWHMSFAQFKISRLLETPLTVNCAEEAMMYYKALFFNDFETCGKIVDHIMQEGHPGNVKKMGRAVKNYNEHEWKIARYGLVTYVEYCKYSQNPDLRKILVDTGDRIIVEASPSDVVWGVGLGEGDPLLLDEKNWRGENLLGKSLMEVRSLLK